MGRIVISGYAVVCQGPHDEEVVDPRVLQSLDGLAYADERFTDYIGGSTLENAVAAALKPGGHLRFTFQPGERKLRVTTEFHTHRSLTSAELRFLVDDTLGQWSDGVGENWACLSTERCGYAIFCLAERPASEGIYPFVHVFDD